MSDPIAGLTKSCWRISSSSTSMRWISAAALLEGHSRSASMACLSLYWRLKRRAVSACSHLRARLSKLIAGMLIYSLRPWSFYTFCGLLLHLASACRASQQTWEASAVSLPAIRSCRIRLIQFYTLSYALSIVYGECCVSRSIPASSILTSSIAASNGRGLKVIWLPFFSMIYIVFLLLSDCLLIIWLIQRMRNIILNALPIPFMWNHMLVQWCKQIWRLMHMQWSRICSGAGIYWSLTGRVRASQS